MKKHSNKQKTPSPPNQFSNKETLERINFLAEISKVAAQDPDLVDLAQYLGSEANQIAQKSKMRIKPKQLFCKNCRTPLVPPLTAEIIKSHNVIHYKCKMCNKERKQYLSEKDKPISNKQHIRYIQDVSNDGISTIFSSKTTTSTNP